MRYDESYSKSDIVDIINLINQNNQKKIIIRCARALQGDRETETLTLDYINNSFIFHDSFANSSVPIDIYNNSNHNELFLV